MTSSINNMGRIIKVGLSSYGMSGMVFHGPLLKTHPGFEVVKIVERSKNIAASIYGNDTIVRSFDELLADKNVELAVINTPDATHFEFAKAALNAGKHVVLEKPFVQRVEQGEDLIELARQKGLVLTVFQNRRGDGDFLTVKKVLENKLLGRLVEFESHFDRYRNFIQPNTWKETAEAGTGIVYNLGSHLIDQALFLFGKPESIHADIRTMRTGGEVDDFFDIDLFYPHVKVKLKSSYLVREEGPRFILHGTEGSFLKWGLDPQEAALKSGQLPGNPGWGTEGEKDWGVLNTTIGGMHVKGRVETLAGDYPAFYANLYEVLANGAGPAVKAEESLLGLRLIEAAFESSKKGARVKIMTL